jgi:hypothetical protein
VLKGEVIPEAKEAMKILNGANEYNIKVQVYVGSLNSPRRLTLARPYIFVTNVGGKTEEEHSNCALNLTLKSLSVNSSAETHLCEKWQKDTRQSS